MGDALNTVITKRIVVLDDHFQHSVMTLDDWELECFLPNRVHSVWNIRCLVDLVLKHENNIRVTGAVEIKRSQVASFDSHDSKIGAKIHGHLHALVLLGNVHATHLDRLN